MIYFKAKDGSVGSQSIATDVDGNPVKHEVPAGTVRITRAQYETVVRGQREASALEVAEARQARTDKRKAAFDVIAKANPELASALAVLAEG